jgi:uncharacterized protein YndB with AHSA1/START domain
MDASTERERVTGRTTVERTSDRDLVVSRTFNGPPHLVFEAWTTPALLQRWWAPKSTGMVLVSCEADVRTGGTYRFSFAIGDAAPMAFHGTYVEVVPNARLVWTNDEAGDAGAVTTVTFEARGDKTLVVVHERYPSKQALDEARASGVEAGTVETFAQLDELLAGLTAGRS